VSRLPTPGYGERPPGDPSGDWRESIMVGIGPTYQATISRVGYGADPLTTSARPDLEEKGESTPMAWVGTVDHNYEIDRRIPLRVVGELTGDATVDGAGGTVGVSTGSRVEEKLKRMREKRRDIERV
jgi:hypothetical protein